MRNPGKFPNFVGSEAGSIIKPIFLGTLLWVIAHFAFFLFFAGMEVGLLQICLAVHQGKEVTFRDAFSSFAPGPIFLVGQMLYLAMVLVGFVFILIPGVYLGIRFAWFGFCFLEREGNLAQSFRRSATMSAGSEISLFYFFVFLILLNLVGASLLGLGLIITVPLTVLMMTSVYRQLGRA